MPPTEKRRWLPPYLPKFRKLVLNNREFTTSNFIDKLADAYQDRPAFYVDKPLNYSFFKGDEIDYKTLLRFVNRIGNALLKMGAGPGDRIALITMNRLELAFAEYAAMKIGCIPVPFNFLLKVNELQYQVGNCGAKILFTDRPVFENTIRDRSNLPSIEKWIMVTSRDVPEGFFSLDEIMRDSSDELEPYAGFNPDDVGIIFYTSGTTGLPKGAALSKRGVLYPIRRYSAISAAIPFNRNQLALLVMPIAHSGGNQNMMLLLSIGIPMMFVGRFSPDGILEMIEKYKATFFAGIPTMYRMLLAAGANERDLTSINVWGGGADFFSNELVETFREMSSRRRFGVKIKPAFIRGYGLAETNSTLTVTPPWAAGEGCIGWLYPGFEYRIIDEDGKDVPRGEAGELIVRGPTILKEYWQDPEKTGKAVRDGWFYTGDQVRQGRYRLLYFLDRGKDIIKCSGWPIYPTELERTIEQHPEVDRACVIGVPDEVKGQLPIAMVTVKPGKDASPEELYNWARERISAYKCPRYFVVIDKLPMTISLKTRKVELVSIYEEAVKEYGGHAHRKLSIQKA